MHRFRIIQKSVSNRKELARVFDKERLHATAARNSQDALIILMVHMARFSRDA